MARRNWRGRNAFTLRGPPGCENKFGGRTMLSWAITFLVLAVVAALFGFGIIASAFAGIAQIIFFVFIALFVLSLLFGAVRTPPAT
jgi:uncharacterized membrane protein YtjA (UPF0391 family)